jgi:hypothetical protein
MHSRRNSPGPPATQQRHVRQRPPTCCAVVLGSELIDGGSFDELCRRINEMLMLATVDEFEPERLAPERSELR